MKIKTIVSVFIGIAVFFTISISQTPDATVIVHQNTLNGFLNAVGPMSGTDKYSVLGAKGDYTWTVQNAKIDLLPNQARFSADANVKVGPLGYGSVATGDVEITYNKETNRISVKVLKASFEVYTKVFGKKIHISDVDLSRFYKPEFEFAGPQPIQSSVAVTLPNNTTKTVYISTMNQSMKIEQSQIVVTSNLKFSDQPPTK